MKNWGNYHRELTIERAKPNDQPHTSNNTIGKSHGSYREQLFDNRWKEKRQQVLERDSHSCKFCSKKTELHVHHRQYHFSQAAKAHLPPWEYDNRYLVTVCKQCHDKGHQMYKVPTFKVK